MTLKVGKENMGYSLQYFHNIFISLKFYQKDSQNTSTPYTDLTYLKL